MARGSSVTTNVATTNSNSITSTPTIRIANVGTKNDSLKAFIKNSTTMSDGIVVNESFSVKKLEQLFDPQNAGYNSIWAKLPEEVTKFNQCNVDDLLDINDAFNILIKTENRLFAVIDITESSKPTWSDAIRDNNGNIPPKTRPDGKQDAVKFSLKCLTTNTPLDILVSNKAENEKLIAQFSKGDVITVTCNTSDRSAENRLPILWLRPSISFIS